MQYVRSVQTSLSATWNSINPATLSGAIDVIVVEQQDGSLACSPFHIRFGKFSLLRPYEKKVEFRVNGERVDYAMKLGEGGEAFFVFETEGRVPEGLQTSPPVSPAASPALTASAAVPASKLPEGVAGAEARGEDVEPLDLRSAGEEGEAGKRAPGDKRAPRTSRADAGDVRGGRARSDGGRLSPLAPAPHAAPIQRPLSAADFSAAKTIPSLGRTNTDSALPATKAALASPFGSPDTRSAASLHRSGSPPPPASNEEARTRAMNLSRKLWTSNISNQVTDSGDLMLDMTGFKSRDGDALHAEAIARQLLTEEMDGPYDIGALIGADGEGNIWIYSSEEAKEAASRKAVAVDSGGLGAYNPGAYASTDALSDPGYHSDDARSESDVSLAATTSTSSAHVRRDSDSAVGLHSTPASPTTTTSSNDPPAAAGDPNKNYAKTLRLTSTQLRALNLQRGPNSMSFTVNRATCTATLYYWHHTTPIVISDIDGTITKSDVLGHVLNSLGRDWTHQGVAKLYTEIAGNGYNFLYLTSRSVGQADATRGYLRGVVQDGGYRLPDGPVILSPDRTIAALRREVYLRKPEIFKMACLRDIMALFTGHGGAQDIRAGAEAGLHAPAHLPGALGSGRGKAGSPFYAGFGNRLTDALSYRSVNIPSTRIFTINSNSEVSLDLLSLNKYKTAYGSMREIVDHYFPPVVLLVKGGGEEFTDFNYWRERPLDIANFTDSEDEDAGGAEMATGQHRYAQPERLGTKAGSVKESVLSEDEAGDEMLESYLSDPRASLDDSLAELDTRDITAASTDLDVEDEEEEEEEEEDGGVDVETVVDGAAVAPDTDADDEDEEDEDEEVESAMSTAPVTPFEREGRLDGLGNISPRGRW